MPKASIKKVVKKVAPKKTLVSKSKKIQKEITDDIKVLKKKIISLAKDAKKKYDSTDDKNKKQIVASIASATAILSSLFVASKIKNRKK